MSNVKPSFKNKALISVIIPTYNRKDKCIRAIESVMQQNITDIEIIVIDDGSSDQTKDALAHYKDKIIYLSQKNKGAPAARNLGLKKATGDYLAFLDSDDYFSPSHLSDMLKHLSEDPSIEFIFSNTIRDKNPTMAKHTFLHNKVIPGFGLYSSSMRLEILSNETWIDIIAGNIIPPSTSVFRRDIQENIFFNERFIVANDVEFFSKLLKNRKIAFLNKIGAHCETGDDNLTNASNNKVRFELKLELIQNIITNKKYSSKLEFYKLQKIKSYLLIHYSSIQWQLKSYMQALINRSHGILIDLRHRN